MSGARPAMTLRHRLSTVRDRWRLWLARLRGDTIVHFLHISKTGGTALRHALRKQRPGRGFHAVFHPHEVTLRDIPRGDKVVFFLRDPCSRFVSGFMSRRQQGRPRYNVPWNAAEQAAFDRFDSPQSLARALSSDDAGRREAAGAAMQGIRLVRDRYSYWLRDGDYLEERRQDLFHVGLQETLQADFEQLRDALGFGPGLALPTDPVQAHRGIAATGRELEGDARRNIEQWYLDDAHLLAWCRDYREGH
jgi:hypothetical protein